MSVLKTIIHRLRPLLYAPPFPSNLLFPRHSTHKPPGILVPVVYQGESLITEGPVFRCHVLSEGTECWPVEGCEERKLQGDPTASSSGRPASGMNSAAFQKPVAVETGQFLGLVRLVQRFERTVRTATIQLQD